MSDSIEVKIKFLNKQLNIVEKKPTGTLRTEYKFKKQDWSKTRMVLDSVFRETFEGNQSIKSKSVLMYTKVDDKYWLLSKISSETTQRVNLSEDEKVFRKLTEKFNFYDIAVNQGVAESKFKKSN